MVTFTSPLLSFFNIKKTTRYYVIASIIASYGLVMYEFFPKLLLGLNSLMYYFVIPAATITAILCLLPSILKNNKTDTEQYASSESVFTSETSTDPILETEIIQNNSTLDTESIPEQTIIPESIEIPQVTAESMDNSAIQEIIQKKIEPVGEELYKIKGDTALLKEDLSTIKTSISDMFTKFEEAMIDLKSVQAEITNPLNFVQKNSESNEFKDVLAIQSTDSIGHLAFVPESVSGDTNLKQNNLDAVMLSNQTANKLDNFKEMFGDKVTLGKMMSIVSLVGEMMLKSGKNSVSVLTEQCRIMGLDPGMEHTIHSIAEMLDNSSMSVDETLIHLYKFGQIVGINDKEANDHYIRLISNVIKQEHRIPHEAYF